MVQQELLKPPKLSQKTCSLCGVDYPLTEYYTHKRGWNIARCKKCLRQITKEWRINNLERSKLAGREYYKKTRDKQIERAYIWRQENWEKYRATTLLRTYGITYEEYKSMLVKQNNRCAICKGLPKGGRNGKYLHVDHEHKSKKVRGLLCHSCNVGIGHFDHDIKLLDTAKEYLIKARSNGNDHNK